MKSPAKIFAILVCALVCAGGAIFARKADIKASEPKTHVSPVTNDEQRQTCWLQV
jgi:hypothetical protein